MIGLPYSLMQLMHTAGAFHIPIHKFSCHQYAYTFGKAKVMIIYLKITPPPLIFVNKHNQCIFIPHNPLTFHNMTT